MNGKLRYAPFGFILVASIWMGCSNDTNIAEQPPTSSASTTTTVATRLSTSTLSELLAEKALAVATEDAHEALETIDQAIETHPSDALLLIKGEILETAGEQDEAMELYDGLIANGSAEIAKAYKARGLLRGGSGNYTGAVTDLTAYLNENPDDKTTQNILELMTGLIKE